MVTWYITVRIISIAVDGSKWGLYGRIWGYMVMHGKINKYAYIHGNNENSCRIKAKYHIAGYLTIDQDIYSQ